MKYKHQQRWRAASLALAAAGALLCSSAAWAVIPPITPRDIDASPVQLTCSSGLSSVTETFLTDTGTWGVKGDAATGYGAGQWFAPHNITEDTPQPTLWKQPPTFGGQWLVPGLTIWGSPTPNNLSNTTHLSTAEPYLLARAVKLNGAVNTGDVKVHIDYLVDDFLTGVSVTQDKNVVHSAIPSSTLSGTDSWRNIQAYDFNGGSWKSGINYLVFKIKNDGPYLWVKGPGGSGGAFGFAAKVTITATCKALPGSGAAAVPVNNPWALGLLGLAVAGAAARTRRRSSK